MTAGSFTGLLRRESKVCARALLERDAVDLIARGRSLGVPVLAVDTPTAVDLTSGEPSDPVVRADVTITFHRPKQGLEGRAGKVLAGRVLVAPIGIPPEADPA